MRWRLVNVGCRNILSQDLQGVKVHHMDPLALGGALIAGIGVGLSQINWRHSKQESGLVTCHCECGAKQEPTGHNTARELLLAVALGFVLGALVVIVFQLKTTFVGFEASPQLWWKKLWREKAKRGVWKQHSFADWAMNMFNEGGLDFLDYGEVPPCIHCRLIGPHLTGSLYMIVTRDLDIYEEDMSPANPDLVSFTPGLGGLGSQLPPGLNRNHVYSFGPMTAQEYQALMQRARTAAAAYRVHHGLPPPGMPVAPQPQPVVVAEGVQLPAGSVTLGSNKALVPEAGGALAVKQVAKSLVGTMEVQDLRTLPLIFDQQGNRRQEFALTVARMSQDEMPGGGLLLDGPASTLGVLKSMAARGLTPVTDHEHWVRTHDLPRGDRSVYEMEVLTRALEAFAMNDQLNLPNSRGIELLMRRWQLIREARRISPELQESSKIRLPLPRRRAKHMKRCQPRRRQVVAAARKMLPRRTNSHVSWPTSFPARVGVDFFPAGFRCRLRFLPVECFLVQSLERIFDFLSVSSIFPISQFSLAWKHGLGQTARLAVSGVAWWLWLGWRGVSLNEMVCQLAHIGGGFARQKTFPRPMKWLVQSMPWLGSSLRRRGVLRSINITPWLPFWGTLHLCPGQTLACPRVKPFVSFCNAILFLLVIWGKGVGRQSGLMKNIWYHCRRWDPTSRTPPGRWDREADARGLWLSHVKRWEWGGLPHQDQTIYGWEA